MSTEVTVSLPERVYNQAAWLAQLTCQDVSQVLAEVIESGLSPLGSSLSATLKPVEELSDNEVLEVAELQMAEAQGERLGKLLDRRQAGELSEYERNELASLMQVYYESLVRKARGMAEAVRRGLMEPLES